ncbi:hypothetical protein [Thauera sinica]|uniref:Uncharacterized protein n=1 Tax=Thauera sinica TaxID=2665146 RepID=A0ABW1AM20_9RHOO|nr:hypothetical protein [Thauera sp. K11]ATE59203.1 hypothetical protein CCZ27_03835 [Thauera sp. K11]
MTRLRTIPAATDLSAVARHAAMPATCWWPTVRPAEPRIGAARPSPVPPPAALCEAGAAAYTRPLPARDGGRWRKE